MKEIDYLVLYSMRHPSIALQGTPLSQEYYLESENIWHHSNRFHTILLHYIHLLMRIQIDICRHLYRHFGASYVLGQRYFLIHKSSETFPNLQIRNKVEELCSTITYDLRWIWILIIWVLLNGGATVGSVVCGTCSEILIMHDSQINHSLRKR